MQLFPLIAGCKIVLPDGRHRKLITTLFRSLHEVYLTTMRGGQLWWLDSELNALQAKLSCIVKEMGALQQILLSKVPESHKTCVSERSKDGGNCPGNGMATMKFHEFSGGIVEHIRRNGQLSNSSTKLFEERNKDAKKAEKSARSRRDKPKDKQIVARLAVNEAADGTHHQRPEKRQKRQRSDLSATLALATGSCEGTAQFSLIGASTNYLDKFFSAAAGALCQVSSIEPPGGMTGSKFKALFMSTLPTSAVEDVTVANGVRFRVSSGRACEVTIGHFIEFGCDGAKAQVLCAVQRGKGDVQMVVWLFKPLREGPENPTIDDSTGHEH
jgi:hypothetical protein